MRAIAISACPHSSGKATLMRTRVPLLKPDSGKAHVTCFDAISVVGRGAQHNYCACGVTPTSLQHDAERS
jgi:hypothetical protein